MKTLSEVGIWNRAREMNKTIFELSTQEPLCKDYNLVNQIRRSSRSVMDNIAEGYGRGGNKEFIQFLSIAKGSCTELESQLCQLMDCEYIGKPDFEMLLDQNKRILAGIVNLTEYLRNSDFKGNKFR